MEEYFNELKEQKDINIELTTNNVFSMDNESFRFLWAAKQGIEFPDEDYKNFELSWKKSVDETSRLLKHVMELEPHRTMETVTLNEARRIILTLAQPLTIITQSIQVNSF